MTLAAVTLDDKYTLETGRVYLTGTQALVRLPLMQRQRDQAAGLKTGCYISGYRGSPLGTYDMALWQARAFLERNHIRFQAGVNEDLAATAIWGAQQLNLFEKTEFDDVFGIWYGKGPGVDRSGDVLRHANLAGSSPHGGVLALMGDDHMGKSSTTCHQSEFAMVDAMIPVLSPAGVQEFLDLGLHGWAMSRYAGTWTGFKCVTMTVDSSASVHVDPERVRIVTPDDFEMPEGGLNIRWPDHHTVQEERLHRYKMPAVRAYARANKLDRLVYDSPKAWLGIASAGKSYLDVLQAFEELGIGEREAAELGIRLYKVAMTWPLEPEGALAFADGLEDIVVVEEKRGLIEDQLKQRLYERRDAGAQPRVIGKTDEQGHMLFPSHGELSAEMIAVAIARRLIAHGGNDRLKERAHAIERRLRPDSGVSNVIRTPYFCSGCPHSSSTKVPEGSRALSGIGCHYLAQFMDRNTATYTQMGGEGASYLGQAPFNGGQHIFANIGDGTYFHSGLLAIRAAVASGANMTYKILYNDAVAMTGGQHVDGNLTVPQITFQLHGEGIGRIAVVSDEPDKYPIGTDFAPGTTFDHRDELDRVQRELREWPGVSVLIYDQTCATEKRRRRKRGTMVDPDKRAFINDAVCEGCGDCSVTSNCVSVEPLETEFGRKRSINQSTCNKDFSCVKGFCPSFVTVEGGSLRRAEIRQVDDSALAATPPEPELPDTSAPHGILVTGVGGTGVVTLGALIGMAAHIEGKGCTVLDMTGLAQKGGPVLSHIKIAETPEAIHAVMVGPEKANALIACDLVVGAGRDALSRVAEGTNAVVNTHDTPVAGFVHDPDLDMRGDFNQSLIAKATGVENAFFIEATRLATALFGDSIATNVFMLGVAFQKGLIPVSSAALLEAIRLNGTAVASNRRAFQWGRLAAHDPAAVAEVAAPQGADVVEVPKAQGLDELLARRVDELTRYQNRAYAERYRALIERVRAAEHDKAPGREGLAEAVARYAFKLMAYKDEYEVARLYTDGAFLDKIRRTFDGKYRLTFHLAPPLLARPGKDGSAPRKMTFGPSMMTVFRVLAKLKGLRGTPFDVFGYSRERRTERRLIGDYFATVEELIAELGHDNHSLAMRIAEMPEHIRGFGHVKERHLAETKRREAELLAAWRRGEAQPAAAE